MRHTYFKAAMAVRRWVQAGFSVKRRQYAGMRTVYYSRGTTIMSAGTKLRIQTNIVLEPGDTMESAIKKLNAGVEDLLETRQKAILLVKRKEKLQKEEENDGPDETR